MLNTGKNARCCKCTCVFVTFIICIMVFCVFVYIQLEDGSADQEEVEKRFAVDIYTEVSE